jgi:hypothetical protein
MGGGQGLDRLRGREAGEMMMGRLPAFELSHIASYLPWRWLCVQKDRPCLMISSDRLELPSRANSLLSLLGGVKGARRGFSRYNSIVQ